MSSFKSRESLSFRGTRMQYFRNQRQQPSTRALSTFSASPPILPLHSPTLTVARICMYVCVCYLGGLYTLNYRFKTIFKISWTHSLSLPPSPTPESHVWFYSKPKPSSSFRYLLHTCSFSTLLSHRLWSTLHGAAMGVTGKHAKQ